MNTWKGAKTMTNHEAEFNAKYYSALAGEHEQQNVNLIIAEATVLCRNAEPLGDGYSKVLTQDLEALEQSIA